MALTLSKDNNLRSIQEQLTTLHSINPYSHILRAKLRSDRFHSSYDDNNKLCR